MRRGERRGRRGPKQIEFNNSFSVFKFEFARSSPYAYYRIGFSKQRLPAKASLETALCILVHWNPPQHSPESRASPAKEA